MQASQIFMNTTINPEPKAPHLARALRCEFEHCRFGRPEIALPINVFVGEQIARKFWNRTYGDVYVSPCGSVFCHLACYSDYLAD
jgi:hypothetical protein